MTDYDVIIIGAGAAGLTAAIYTCRKKLKTLVVSADVGGQTNLTNHIENYPGVDAMPGPSLMQKFRENAESFGAEIKMGKVEKILKEKNIYRLHLAENGELTCRAVILCHGKIHKELGIPGEAKFLGKGVSTCATCDAPLFRNKSAAVVGGGNSAVEAALELAVVAKKVYLIHRRDEFRADEISVHKLKEHKNIELLLSYCPLEIKGEKFVKSVVVKNLKSNAVSEVFIDGLFVEIGFVVENEMVKDLVKVNQQGEIIIDDRNRTFDAGIFAAGDVTTVPYKQTVISAGEGAIAALECYKYLTGGKGSMIDWGK
ncbi:MAG: FAD-dependent oxidoreductase [Candidatus Aenigmarchaeota archaeon]|nr:FAD-dependent oxidoreductase [Candidatus Aenigmarchaeota archaeon]